MDVQNDFFTLQSLATFAGAVGATVVIANGLQRAFNFNPAWIGLVIAEIICIATVWFTYHGIEEGTTIIYSDFFVAVVNGFLVFCSAAGSSALGSKAVGTSESGATQRGHVDSGALNQRRHFFTPWF
jgi:hypothetical protein